MNKSTKNTSAVENYEDIYIKDQPVNYETAISLVNFGKYNYCFLLSCLPTMISNLFATSTISYVLSQAQCDLDLSLENKGMLNAIPYIGMITSGVMWGTLADIYGRRIVLITALLLESICAITASLSRTYLVLLTAKYFSGFMICGSIALSVTYISEFHHHTFRPKLITIIGVYSGIGKIILPLLAWFLLPLQIHIIIIPGYIELKSWQCYILVCSVAPILSSVIHFILPESPKFLMTKGKYQEAMKIFMKMYCFNNKKHVKSLPFCRLTDDTYENKNISNNEQSKLYQILNEVKPLFTPPFCYKLATVACINFGCLLGSITLRLWLPQLLATMDQYNHSHNKTSTTKLCDLLNYTQKITSNKTIICEVPELSSETYLNNIIVPVCSIILYFVIGCVVTKVGKKNLLVVLPIIGAISILSNYFSKSSLTTVILSSIYLAFVGVNSLVCTSVSIELFPTNLRAKALALFVIFGRLGPLVGNVSFPFLLYAGCLTPFIFIASFALLCAILSIFLPNTERKALV